MQHLSTILILVAAAINLAPAVGAASPERMATLYGLVLDNPNLEILMRHRAVLFGIVGSLLVVAAFHRPLRAVGYASGFASMISFSSDRSGNHRLANAHWSTASCQMSGG